MDGVLLEMAKMALHRYQSDYEIYKDNLKYYQYYHILLIL